MSKTLSKKFYKTLLKYFYYVILAIIILYAILLMFLLYIGPITTYRVKHALKQRPQNIVVSLTTTPYRIDTIRPILESISRQTVQPNKIYVNVPWRFKRDNSEYKIPEWLKTYPGVVINRTKDYGPATKLVATLEKERDPETIIITIDDDTLYPKQIVRDLVQQYLFDNNAKHAVITGLGFNFLFFLDKDLYYTKILCPGCQSLILVGVSGVAYKRKFFANDIFTLTDNLPISCFLSDDLMLSSYLAKNNINIVKASGFAYNKITMNLFVHLESGLHEDALQKGANNVGTGSNESNYVACITELLQSADYYPYATSILARSKILSGTNEKDLLFKVLNHLYYTYYIKGIFRLVPFMLQLLVKTMY